ncbi:clustering-based subsystem [Methylobacterium phyllosphaerae]|uniref:Clustering-based subsystem n=1 Tax=Methylobacterium phyllosphaerae TaxID=418223 RepID=A0AAE8HUV4_9HYPH|nr:glycosyltransferase [Methylobacterium phyllosphaerae]APT30077.1 clustering-based subsystem [Methylobacterium phyllosphaerae]SFH31423.1 Glycosyltransferase involved in cell wall bisynthesis [Methylobacterium phyllosphaerae]
MTGVTLGAAGPRVLLNLVRLLPSEKGAGGAGRLALALLAHLPRRVQLRVAIPHHWRSLIPAFPTVSFEVVDDDSNASLRRLLSWCECYVDPLNGLRPTLIDPKIAVISFVLDLQHLRMPWLYTEEQMAGRLAEYGYAIDRSDWLVAISEYERDNLADFYGVDRVSVVHLAGFMAEDSGLDAEAVRAKRAEVGDEASYLIYPAVPWPHKNHDILIQAIAILKRRGLSVPVALTNTSGQTAEKERLGRVAAAFGVDDLVDLHGFLDEAALLDLVILSRGMVFPSLYEGFGIPLVDAMALGVPVLANPAAAVPEICGAAVTYMDNASNALALADDIAAFWTGTETRKDLVNRGLERARDFSSEKMVADLADAIDAAVAAKTTRALPPASRFTPPRYNELAVFVAYGRLTEADRAHLREAGDIHAWHARAFGADAVVTVGLDIALVDDPDLSSFFGAAAKLILFDASDPASLDTAVADFATRYDHAEFQLVTAYRDRLSAYSATAVRSVVSALRLFTKADCAEPDTQMQDCKLEREPSEQEGVIAYQQRRGTSLAIRDVLLRRASARGLRNGTVGFLSAYCTRYARLRVPIVRPQTGVPHETGDAL